MKRGGISLVKFPARSQSLAEITTSLDCHAQNDSSVRAIEMRTRGEDG
jgi:hypothetical protein